MSKNNINNKMIDLLNEQINLELEAWYVYYKMSIFFEDINMKGFAKWMKKQSQEEFNHADKISNHILSRDNIPELKNISIGNFELKSTLEVFEKAYEHEKKVTSSIHEIYSYACDIKDYASKNFLEWFISEQVEEEDSVLYILSQVKRLSKSDNGLYLLDLELQNEK